MGFFDDERNPFEDIMKEFFGGRDGFVEYSDNSNNKKKFYQKNRNVSSNNFIESKGKVYFVLDLSNKEGISVSVNESNFKNEFGGKSHKEYVLKVMDSKGDILEYLLPRGLHKKDFNWEHNNGILEVVFKK